MTDIFWGFSQLWHFLRCNIPSFTSEFAPVRCRKVIYGQYVANCHFLTAIIIKTASSERLENPGRWALCIWTAQSAYMSNDSSHDWLSVQEHLHVSSGALFGSSIGTVHTSASHPDSRVPDQRSNRTELICQCDEMNNKSNTAITRDKAQHISLMVHIITIIIK